MRAAALMLLLAGAAHADTDCAWQEPTGARTFEPDGRVVWLKYALDRDWFECARKAGGTLTVEFLVGTRDRLEPTKPKKVGSVIREGAWQSSLCDKKPIPDTIVAKLTGTGPMERLTWTSPKVAFGCPRCPDLRPDLRVQTLFDREPAEVELQMDPAWHGCAKSGSTLHLRVYSGPTAEDVDAEIHPVVVLRGLESSAKSKRTMPRAKLCTAGAKFAGYDLVGTGEMETLSTRNVFPLRCP